jgi:hypothetical protein
MVYVIQYHLFWFSIKVIVKSHVKNLHFIHNRLLSPDVIIRTFQILPVLKELIFFIY